MVSMQRALLVSVCVVGLLSHGTSLLKTNRTVDIIRSYKYHAEEHSVETEDGYVLSITHIKSSGKKIPVLMVHGLLGASDQWVVRGPKKDLPFILVDRGHDVWLADSRGNHFSRKHTYLNTSSEAYWDFSFHENGLYDLPAFIKKIQQHSTFKQVNYIGHSMGTTVYYVMCSLRPEYNQLIHTAVHLSPIVYAPSKKLPALLQQLQDNFKSIAAALKMLKIYEFIPRSALNQIIINFICHDHQKKLCLFVNSILYGLETAFTDNRKLKKYLKTLYSGTSVKTMVHMNQIFKSGNFSQFDYDKERNLKVYKTEFPPAYPLQKVTSRIALFYTDNDVYIDKHSIKRLRRILPNVIKSISIPKYNHIDFLFADSAPKLVYKIIVKLLNK